MRGFGDLEGAIMERVWSAGRPLLVREIQQALESGRAYNTVQTVTEILCRKGWLAREKDGVRLPVPGHRLPRWVSRRAPGAATAPGRTG